MAVISGPAVDRNAGTVPAALHLVMTMRYGFSESGPMSSLPSNRRNGAADLADDDETQIDLLLARVFPDTSRPAPLKAAPAPGPTSPVDPTAPTHLTMSSPAPAQPRPASAAVGAHPAPRTAVAAAAPRPARFRNPSLPDIATSLLRLSPAFIAAVAEATPKARRTKVPYILALGVVAVVGIIGQDGPSRTFLVDRLNSMDTGVIQSSAPSVERIPSELTGPSVANP